MRKETARGSTPDRDWPEEQEGLRQALAALGQTQRFRICRLLLSQPRSVGALVEATRLPQPLVSHHLSVLRQAGLIDREPRSRGREIRLSESAGGFVSILLELLKRGAGSGGWGLSEGAAEPRERRPGGQPDPGPDGSALAAEADRPAGIEDYLL